MLRHTLLAVTVLPFLASGAFAAIGSEAYQRVAAADPSTMTDTHVAQADDAARLRQAGEKACVQAMDLAAVMGEKFRQMSAEMPRLMLETRDEIAREMAPTLRSLADRLGEMARQLERGR